MNVVTIAGIATIPIFVFVGSWGHFENKVHRTATVREPGAVLMATTSFCRTMSSGRTGAVTLVKKFNKVKNIR